MEKDVLQPMSFSVDSYISRDESNSSQKIDSETEREVVEVQKKIRKIYHTTVILGTIFSIIVLSFAIDSILFAKEVFALNPAIGYIYSAFWLVLLYYFGQFIVSQIMQYMSLRKVDSFRESFKNGSGKELYRKGFELVDSYSDTLSIERSQQLKERLKSIKSDEVVVSLNSSLMLELDSSVEKVIFKYAKENGVVTAVSQMALLDLIFLLWRNSRMVSEIASIYGFRSGFTGNLIILRRVTEQLLFIGVTEIVEHSAGALAGQTVASKLSTSVAQGVGHSILTVRIGISAMQVCRPIEEERSRTELIGKFLKDVGSLLNPMNLFRKG
jgi:putative membrane protein